MPHQVQHKLAGNMLPVLAYAIPAFELFMSNWEKLATKQPRLKPFIDEGLRFAYIHYQKMDQTTAYIICMCEYFLSISQWIVMIDDCPA